MMNSRRILRSVGHQQRRRQGSTARTTLTEKLSSTFLHRRPTTSRRSQLLLHDKFNDFAYSSKHWCTRKNSRRVQTLSTSTSPPPPSPAPAPAPAPAANTATAIKTVVPAPPTARQLYVVALRAGIPMIGFGFMDNIVMINAGAQIDASLGVIFTISTMTAAGFGQCFSDVAGITCGGIVDATVAKMNLPHHNLSPKQMDMKITRLYSTIGGCIGVVLGCLLGMTCLFFIDTDKADRAKRAKELQSIFETVMTEGTALVDAERVSLFMLDHEKDELWSRVATGTEGIIKISSKSGLVGAAVTSNTMINVANAYEDLRFNKRIDEQTGFKTQSVIVVPFEDEQGKVLGAIEMINKKQYYEAGKEAAGGSGGDSGNHVIGVFDSNDEKLLKMLASHVRAFIKTVNKGGD